jgi:hypothetical protein
MRHSRAAAIAIMAAIFRASRRQLIQLRRRLIDACQIASTVSPDNIDDAGFLRLTRCH